LLQSQILISKWEETMKFKLGDNFKQYPYIPTLPWDAGRCGWRRFKAQTIDGFVIRLLKTEENPKIAKVWRLGFPELYRGSYGFVLDPKAYNVFAGKEWRMFVFDSVAEKSIAGAWLLRMDHLNLSIDFSLVMVHPKFRGKGLLAKTSAVLDKYVEACGVELATVACATFHVATRKVFRKLGFREVGILPGAIRANVMRNRYRRDSVEILYKLYGNADEIVPPIQELEKGGC
jgi:RimJ/RimL family protein N-acetyltransferase